jgi:hypothetical protein
MLDGAAAVAALVLLAGRLATHAEPGGDFWPPDAQTDSVIDQHKSCASASRCVTRARSISSSTWDGDTRLSGRAGMGFSARLCCCDPGGVCPVLAADRRLDLLT